VTTDNTPQHKKDHHYTVTLLLYCPLLPPYFLFYFILDLYRKYTHTHKTRKKERKTIYNKAPYSRPV